MSDYGLATHSWDMASHNSATIESGAASTSPTISAARDKTRILLEADELVTRNSLHDFRDLIRKGALLADDPHDYARVDNLTPGEIAALDEDEGKLLAVPTTWVFYGLVGLLYALLSHLHPVDEDCFFWEFSPENPYPVLLIALTLLETPIAVLLSTRLGRRNGLCAAAVMAMLRSSLSFIYSGIRPWPQWGFTARLVDRSLGGIAISIITYIAPLHLAEYGPSSVRGRLLVRWDLAVVACGFTVRTTYRAVLSLIILTDNHFTAQMWRWRDPVVIVCAAILITALPWLALESPHQFITRGHITTAFETLRKTRPSAIVAARDLYRVYAFSPRRSSSLTPAARRAIISSTAIMLTRVLIAPQLLNMYINIRTRSEALRLELDSLSMAVSLSFIMLLGNSTIDANRYGRRRGLILGLAILPIFSVPFFETLDIAINYTLSLFHFASGSFSDVWAAICTVYAVEVLPSHCREKGFALTVSIYQALRVVFESISPIPFDYYEPDDSGVSKVAGVYRLAAMCTFPVTLVLVIFVVRETRKVPLEDMGHLFEARNRDLALYQVRVVWPYLFRRYVLWQKVVLEPFEESRYGRGAIALE